VAKQLNAESYSLLLQALSSNEDVAASEFTKLRDSLVRFFLIKGEMEADEAADETLDRLAAKLDGPVVIENLTKYSFGIARLVFLENLRKTSKADQAVKAYAWERADRIQPDEETDGFSRMRDCFGKLSDPDKDLLRSYFADVPRGRLDEERIQLAGSMGASLNNLRLKIFRLRRRLEDCVRVT